MPRKPSEGQVYAFPPSALESAARDAYQITQDPDVKRVFVEFDFYEDGSLAQMVLCIEVADGVDPAAKTRRFWDEWVSVPPSPDPMSE